MMFLGRAVATVETLAMAVAAGAGPAATEGASVPYGVVAHLSRSEYGQHEMLLDLAMAAGIGYVRVDWDWRICQPTKGGGFDFCKYDKLVDAAESRGIRILPIIYDAPKWASPAWQHADDYAAFCRATVLHYGKRIPVVELWNEQNLPTFWKDPNPSNYVAMCRKAYSAIKEAAPFVRVALGGTSGWAHEFIEACYQAGARSCFDIVSVHPYCSPLPAEDVWEKEIVRLRSVMAKYGDADKPIWFTEIGWPTQLASVTGAGNVLAAGLGIALGEKRPWRVLYAASMSDDAPEDSDVVENMISQMPVGSKACMCGPKETVKLLGEGGWDAVVYPPDETFPIETFDAVVRFVKDGGTLVDLGGMPVWFPYRNLSDGTSSVGDGEGGWERHRRLHVETDVWWNGHSELPKNGSIRVYATEAGLDAGVKQQPTGFSCAHFLTDRALRDGDSWIPLVKGVNPANGKDVVAACVYLLNSDMKGRIVFSGLRGGTAVSIDEMTQAAYFMRGLGLAHALGIEGLFYYELRSPEKDRYYSEDHFGIVHANGVPKLAWLAHRNFAQARPAGSVQLTEGYRKGLLYCPQWRRPDGSVAGMLWQKKCRNLVLSFDRDDVAFVDMMGNPAKVRNQGGGAYSLEVGGFPVYFTGAKLIGALSAPN